MPQEVGQVGGTSADRWVVRSESSLQHRERGREKGHGLLGAALGGEQHGQVVGEGRYFGIVRTEHLGLDGQRLAIKALGLDGVAPLEAQNRQVACVHRHCVVVGPQ